MTRNSEMQRDGSSGADDPVVSVVVPSLNAQSTLGDQLAALAVQQFDAAWELVVVDNGSTDSTRCVAESASCHPRCTVHVVSESRRGLNIARNAGVRAARASLIALCDADDIADAAWLCSLLDALQRFEIVGGSLRYDLLNPPQTCELLGWSGVDEPQGSVAAGLGFLPQAIGANLAFRRTVWEQIGGFDESFDFGGDDVDFVWRAQLGGFSIGPAADAVVNYRGRSTRRQVFRQYVRDGSGSAHLYASFRTFGMPRRSLARALASTASIVVRLPLVPLRSGEEQGHLVRAAGKQWGRVRGSVKHRVVYL